MSDSEVGSAQPNDAGSADQGGSTSGAGSADQSKQQSGRGETRLLGEVKSLKQQLAELKVHNESLEMQKLEADGNKDKMIDHLQQRVQSLETSTKEKDRKYATSVLGGQIKTEAAKMGCQNPDDLIKLVDLDTIPVDPDTFSGDVDSIRIMLEEQKKSRPFFFAKQAPHVMDVNQQNVVNRPQADVSRMSREELEQALKNIGNESYFS